MRRVAVCGFSLESNAFAPVSRRRDFEELALVRGEALGGFLDDGSVLGFGRRLRELRPGDCELLPLVVAVGGAGGPCEHAFYVDILEETLAGLRAAGRLDGVFVFGHGAGTTTGLADLDGHYLRAVREVVGPDTAVVAELDLHANVSRDMVEAADILVGYRTNPHVDVRERSLECAELMHEMFEGMRPSVAWRRLPMVLPSVVQLTGPGQPLGDLVRHAESRMGGPIANVSVLSGFAFSDTPYNGFTIVVTARDDAAAAEALADELAVRAWEDRGRYVSSLVPVEEAVARAVEVGRDPARPPILLADVADNPGGGARGNTPWLLQALLEAGASGVQLGLFYDPALVRAAREAGEGGRFLARFNAEEDHPLSPGFEHEARVRGLVEGSFRGRHGVTAGVDVDLGPCALVEVGGIAVAVASVRTQIMGPEYLEHFGLDPAAARCVVVKSRGHFRAGFEPLIPPERILEVDAPGLATPNLGRLDWRHLPRPVFPMDPETRWSPRASRP